MGLPSFRKKIVTCIKTAAYATGHAISTAAHKAASVAQTIGTKVGHAASKVAKTRKEAVSTVYHDVINLSKTLIDAGGDAFSKIGGSLMLPLTVIGGVAAFALLNK